jgi:hypothetical protein
VTTFTTDDRLIAEKDGSFTANVEPIPFAGMMDLEDESDYEIPTIEFYVPPKPIGWWTLPGGAPNCKTKFSAHKQPRWLTKVMMKYVFEWEWEDDLPK